MQDPRLPQDTRTEETRGLQLHHFLANVNSHPSSCHRPILLQQGLKSTHLILNSSLRHLVTHERVGGEAGRPAICGPLRAARNLHDASAARPRLARLSSGAIVLGKTGDPLLSGSRLPCHPIECLYFALFGGRRAGTGVSAIRAWGIDLPSVVGSIAGCP
jgi:hypothetical protein